MFFLHQGAGYCKTNQVCEGYFEACLVHDWLKDLLAQGHEVGHVDVVVEGKGWSSQVRVDHSFRDSLTHWAHLDDFYALWQFLGWFFFDLSDWSSFYCWCNKGQDVFFDNLTIDTCTCDGREVNTFICCNAGSQWRCFWCSILEVFNIRLLDTAIGSCTWYDTQVNMEFTGQFAGCWSGANLAATLWLRCHCWRNDDWCATCWHFFDGCS